MSIENAHAFLAEVPRNARLRAQVKPLRGAGALARLVEIAGEAGFAFSEAEYRAAVAELAEGQLSDAAINATIDEYKMGRRTPDDAG